MNDQINNGARKRKTDSRPVPGLNVRELIEDRNWAALGGLALIGVGLLYLLESWFGLDINLWSLMLIGVGGWLAYDGWRSYEAAGRVWYDRARNRVLAGSVIAALGVFGVLNLSGWGWLMLIAAGWLAYDAWQRYKANGRIWTQKARNRMVGAGVLAALGLLGAVSRLVSWPMMLILLGVLLLSGVIGKREN